MKGAGSDRRNLGLTSGDSCIFEVTVHNADRSLPSLSGSTITYKVAPTPRSGVVLTKSVGDGIVVTGQGTLEIRLDPEDTADLPGDDYYHELRTISSSGAVTTLMFGTLTIRDDLV